MAQGVPYNVFSGPGTISHANCIQFPHLAVADLRFTLPSLCAGRHHLRNQSRPPPVHRGRIARAGAIVQAPVQLIWSLNREAAYKALI